jgi:hypothetical protein
MPSEPTNGGPDAATAGKLGEFKAYLDAVVLTSQPFRDVAVRRGLRSPHIQIASCVEYSKGDVG